jgi:plasmid maintenance system killer protein
MNKRKPSKLPMIPVDIHPGGTGAYINDMQTTSARDKFTEKQKKNNPQIPKPWEYLSFHCKKLQKMYETGEGSHKYSEAVVENFFEKTQILETVSGEQDLYQHKNLGFHRLKKGQRKGQYAVWLTGNWRLIVEIKESQQSKYLLIVEIVDYH